MGEPVYQEFQNRFLRIIDQEPRIGYIYSFRQQPDGRLEGVLGVDMTASDIIAQELQLLAIMALITLVVAVLGIVGGSVLSKRIVKPLSILAEDMGQIRNLQLTETDLGKSGILKVKTMETALSNMKKGLRSVKRYVPSDVVAQLINREVEARLGTEIHSITSFFSDLENFTTVSENWVRTW